MKRISYLSFIFSLLLATACDNKLDIINPNSQTTATFWKDQNQAFAGVTAIYNGLITDGSYMRTFPGMTDSRGDDFTGNSPWTDLELAGKFIIANNADPVQWIWRDFYITIYRANQVLTNVPNITMDTDLKNRLLGQAHFLRGLSYFNLATTFKAVPLITTISKSQSDNYPPTASEEELWNQIFADFEMAESMLPISYANVSGPDQGQIGRATQGAAAGMLGKAYLYRKEWQKAATQFEKFISGPLKGVYSLMPNYRDNFKPTNENNAESLFEVQFATTAEAGGTITNWTFEPNSNWKQVTAISVTYAMDGKGYSDYLPTRWIYNEYKQEKTKDGKSDPRLFATIASYEPAEGQTTAYGVPWPNPQGNIYPRKYTNDGLGIPFEEVDSGINYRVLRYADILLMYAEALNELGQTNTAYQYIQQVRDRANLPDLATTKPGMSQVAMRDQIAHERALEFAIESQRINDIIRWGWLYDSNKLAMLKAHDEDFNNWTPGNEYLPIPQTELVVNKNLSPNPAN